MKSITTPAVALLLFAFTGLADAAPWGFFRKKPAPEPPRHEERHDHRGNDHRGHDHGRDARRPMRIEARVQLRLRELGFYRGPIDGEFGRGSRASLARFQNSRGLRPSGVLTEVTIRALRL